MQLLGGRTLISKDPGADVVQSEIAGFLDFIADPKTSIPLNSNFGVQFSIPDLVKSEVYTEFENNSSLWNSLEEKRLYLIDKQHSSNSFVGGNSRICVFANGLTLPQEGFGVERKGFDAGSGGILKGVVSGTRADQPPLDMTFLETEYSYIDFILRPWIILGSHLGLFARGSGANIKTNITVFVYSRYGSERNRTYKVRKVYNFEGCVPSRISDAGYAKHDFGINNNASVAKVEWVYNYYTIYDV